MIELRHLEVPHFVIEERSHLANCCTTRCGCIGFMLFRYLSCLGAIICDINTLAQSYTSSDVQPQYDPNLTYLSAMSNQCLEAMLRVQVPEHHECILGAGTVIHMSTSGQSKHSIVVDRQISPLRAQERINVQKKLAPKRVVLSLTIILHR